jgi:hypothetical protein
MYQLGTALLLNGWLGQLTQARSAAQVEASGSLILGGRPELEATAALFRSNPWGFGAGTAPSFTDVTVAKEGMASINYDPNNGYVERYMFGSQFELHSVLGDLWAWFGLGGLLLGGIILVVCTRGISRQLAARTASGLTLFLVWWSLWNLAFSPVESSVPTLALAIALLAQGPEPRETP